MADANTDDKKLTLAERMRARQAKLRDIERGEANARQQLVQDAHDRFTAGRQNFIRNNPGAVSPWERNEAFRERNEETLRKHEMAMLQEKNKGEATVAREKRLGMKEQGADAAHENREATIEAAEKQWSAQKDIATTQGETQRDVARIQGTSNEKIADIQSETQKQISKDKTDAEITKSENQHGYTDKDGVYHPGSDVTKTKIEADAAKSAARDQRLAAIQNADTETQKQYESLLQTTFNSLKNDKRYAGKSDDEIWAEVDKFSRVQQFKQRHNIGSASAPKPKSLRVG